MKNSMIVTPLTPQQVALQIHCFLCVDGVGEVIDVREGVVICRECLIALSAITIKCDENNPLEGALAALFDEFEKER